MRKVILILFAFISLNLFAGNGQVELKGRRINSENKGNAFPRSSVAPLVISLSDYVLSLPECDQQETLTLYQDGSIVYTAVLSSGTSMIEIPSYVVGDCELQLARGNIIYVGQICF